MEDPVIGRICLPCEMRSLFLRGGIINFCNGRVDIQISYFFGVRSSKYYWTLLLAGCASGQGGLLSKMDPLGLKFSSEAQTENLIEETVKTAAIEGQNLYRNSVRSLVAVF